jgi:hypothetical protein
LDLQYKLTADALTLSLFEYRHASQSRAFFPHDARHTDPLAIYGCSPVARVWRVISIKARGLRRETGS